MGPASYRFKLVTSVFSSCVQPQDRWAQVVGRQVCRVARFGRVQCRNQAVTESDFLPLSLDQECHKSDHGRKKEQGQLVGDLEEAQGENAKLLM